MHYKTSLKEDVLNENLITSCSATENAMGTMNHCNESNFYSFCAIWITYLCKSHESKLFTNIY